MPNIKEFSVLIPFFLFLALFSSALTAQQVPTNVEAEETKFKRRLVGGVEILSSGAIESYSSFLSTKNDVIVVKETIFKSIGDAQEAVFARKSALATCGEGTEVVDSEEKKVGVRYECEKVHIGDSETKFDVVLFSYIEVTHEIQSTDLSIARLFEKQSCPHSYSLGGITCPPYFLLRTYQNEIGSRPL
ncbi:MAG: hypothetical protein R2684_16465 [Pyrinomonadaceae bacterium]